MNDISNQATVATDCKFKHYPDSEKVAKNKQKRVM